MENDTLTDVASGKIYKLKPLGEVRQLFKAVFKLLVLPPCPSLLGQEMT